MDHFELFEKVTGRLSLKTGKVFEAPLKEACGKTGAQYHEAADEVLISGTWEQVSETRRFIHIKLEESSARTASRSSSGYSEDMSSKPGRQVFDTSPSVAKYIKRWHDNDLRHIEQIYQVKITWSKDLTKVYIKARSSANVNDDLCQTACDQFARLYQKFHQAVTSIRFDFKQYKSSYPRESLETALSAVPQFVSGIILDISADGSVYTLWGTGQSLNKAKLWIREKLGVSVESPGRTVSPKGPPRDALTHETVNQLKIVIYQGDITKENADIIVNACNEFLDHAGGVSYAISKTGGPSIQKESDEYVKKHGALKAGDVAVTTSGLLHCKRIVHAVGPQWSKHGREGCLKLFQTLFMNIYKTAIKQKAKSVAVPAISSGLYGVPKEVCAQAAFAFVDEIEQKLALDPAARPFEIRLVNIDGEIVEVFTRVFREWLFKGRKVQRRHSITGMMKEEKEETPVKTTSVDDMHKTPRFKASLIDGRRPLPSSAKDGSNTTSKITLGSGGMKVVHSTTTSKVSHRSTLAFSTTSAPSSKVKLIATSVSTSQKSSDPTSAHMALPSSSKPDKPSATAIVRYDQNGCTSHSADNSGDCTICFAPFTDPVSLPKCGHTFCKSCIDRAFTYQKKCPICQEVYGVFEGDQPNGTMDVGLLRTSLPGYEGCGCYVITYVIPGGRQGNRHPKPGHKFTGTTRQAFLPATKEGEIVLNMLKRAFDLKLIFTVGKSNTTGQEDCVTWNDIHHKTSISGGPQRFGYPDPNYLDRVKDELKAKGIVPE